MLVALWSETGRKPAHHRTVATKLRNGTGVWGDGPADTALAPLPGGPGPRVLSAPRIGTLRIAKLKTVLGGAVCNLGHTVTGKFPIYFRVG